LGKRDGVEMGDDEINALERGILRGYMEVVVLGVGK
jgi:hypothetical protein